MNRNFLFSVILGIAVTMMVIDRLTKEIAMTTPVAKKIPHKTIIHGYDRVDNYHWMRLTDKQKLAKNPDAQTQKVLDNLKAENTYKETRLNNQQKHCINLAHYFIKNCALLIYDSYLLNVV